MGLVVLQRIQAEMETGYAATPPRVASGLPPHFVSVVLLFHTCTSFHTCTLLSIRSQLDMPPKASAAGQHTTKQGTSARTGHSKVLTHGVDSASLKRVREGSLVSLDIFQYIYIYISESLVHR